VTVIITRFLRRLFVILWASNSFPVSGLAEDKHGSTGGGNALHLVSTAKHALLPTIYRGPSALTPPEYTFSC